MIVGQTIAFKRDGITWQYKILKCITDRVGAKLAKILKRKSGCGGTCYVDESGGIIELQGQKGELIKQLLSKEGFVHIHQGAV